jgi:hypothetical protein
VPGPDACLLLGLPGAAGLLSGAGPLAYTGPGVGLELTPYFLGLLAWVALALLAVLLWPVLILLRRLRKPKVEQSPEPTPEPEAPSTTEPTSEPDAGGS